MLCRSSRTAGTCSAIVINFILWPMQSSTIVLEIVGPNVGVYDYFSNQIICLHYFSTSYTLPYTIIPYNKLKLYQFQGSNHNP